LGPAAALAILLWAAGAAAQGTGEVRVEVSLKPDSIGLDEQALLAVTVSGAAQNLPAPDMPSLPRFEVYSQGSSSNITIVNGKVSASMTYRYLLVPTKAGVYPIERIAVVYNNRRYEGNRVTLTVLDKGTAMTPEIRRQTEESGEGAKDYFLEAVVDKKQPYVNEQVTLTLKFHIAVQYYGSPELIEPTTTGFWTEVLGNEAPYRQQIGGRAYRVIERKYALFPTQTGELTIGQAAIRVTVPERRQSTRDPFGMFNDFFSSGREVTVRSKPVTVNVRPLPTAGRPDDFTGSIGKYELTARADKNEVEVNQPVTVTFQVSGTGNIKAAAKPPIPQTDDFRVYEASSSENVGKQGDRLAGTKIYEEVFIPRRPGMLEIPAITYSYFDPERGAYATTSTKPIAIQALKPEGYVASGDLPYQGGGVVVGSEARDIRYIKEDIGRPARSGRIILLTPLYLLANGVPVLVLAALIAVRKRREKLAANVGLARSLRAGKMARKRLAKARGLATAAQGQAFYAELHQTLTAYVADKLNVSPHGLTTERLRELLGQQGADEGLVAAVADILQRCDFARFAPASISQEEITRALADVEETMIRLEGIHFA